MIFEMVLRQTSLLMGFASDAMGQVGAVLVMALGILYLLGFWLKGRRA